ncbi:L-rhamnose mutarotase [Colwellia sp. 4_MG-2023]|uniref:L-rhamnose mutarotase n=1 Tax=unclassified Colwellia TaxID=196834 RepID=UPI0026E2A10E|nr:MULTISPECIES: L-rhamnose mutarotase [unclassified Colwellia]MDO6507074.1 L-rhamnose mutarotase [Colwellia sp. 5_MG-2023]MDO6555880.1 L-rhamnose mutarotase [Colwellia sp. 4_MG-2023]
MNKQYCLTLELQDDDELIRLYEVYHQAGNVWPGVIKSIRDSGIKHMAIYRQGTQLMMILDVDETFSFEQKSLSDLGNERVQEWELLMEKFQKIEQGNSTKSKWKLVNRIFSLDEH